MSLCVRGHVASMIKEKYDLKRPPRTSEVNDDKSRPPLFSLVEYFLFYAIPQNSDSFYDLKSKMASNGLG